MQERAKRHGNTVPWPPGVAYVLLASATFEPHARRRHRSRKTRRWHRDKRFGATDAVNLVLILVAVVLCARNLAHR